MIRRIIEISSGAARLSIAHKQLVIERPEYEPATVPCEDVGVLLVDHPAVTYTHGVFTTLLEAGAAVVLCGHDHHPSGLLLPIAANTVQTERYRFQIEAPQPLRKRLWQSLVAAKLRQQAHVLAFRLRPHADLLALGSRVRSGDPDNIEAQGAQRYWPRLFGESFRRNREGPPPNNLLNYGYMVVRAAVARALAGAGLMPTLGLHHRNRYNPFCLADDVLEPFRPFIDLKVRNFLDAAEVGPALTKDEKRAVLSVLNEVIEVGGRKTPLMLALHATAASLHRSFETGEPQLALPNGLFRRPEESDAGDESA
jgi:CRISPR-associated protein Cas1